MSNERSYLASSVRAAHEALLIGLAPAIDDANFDLMMNARQEVAAAIETRLEYLRRLLETESESNLLAGLLTEASLVSDASRLEPLRDLIAAAQRKITKNLNAIPDRAQQEKLTALYKQLGAIGADDGILAARAYELNQQHEAQVAFTAAQKDAAKLKQAVDTLVEHQNSTAQHISGYASSQISSGKFILTVLSIAAVLGAAMVAWLYVGRSVLGGLASSAMQCDAWPVAISPSISTTPAATRSETWGERFCSSVRQQPTWQARAARKASRREPWNRGGKLVETANAEFERAVSNIVQTLDRAAGARWTPPRAKCRTAPAAIRSRRSRPAAASEQATTKRRHRGDCCRGNRAVDRAYCGPRGEFSERRDTGDRRGERPITEAVESLSPRWMKSAKSATLSAVLRRQTNLLALNATIEAARAWRSRARLCRGRTGGQRASRTDRQGDRRNHPAHRLDRADDRALSQRNQEDRDHNRTAQRSRQ
jgi:hypothetical protein